MPTLEDTAVDFPVTTLNDLLEAEAKAGVTVSGDEDKYRRWAFLSTGAAGLLAIILAVVLITGNGDGSDSSSDVTEETAQAPAGWPAVPIAGIGEGKLSDPKAGGYYEINDGGVISKAAMLVSYKSAPKVNKNLPTTFNVVFAVPSEEEKQKLITADKKALTFIPTTAPAPAQTTEAPTTTAPAAEAPAPPTPEPPAPEAPTAETPASAPAG